MIPDLNQEPLTQQPQNLILGLETPNQSQPLFNNPRRWSDKNDPTRLIADALETELVRSNDPCHNSGPGDFFDCNACLSTATDPVVTCCGHLFCWPCFYFLPYETSTTTNNNVKDCPVCGGEVTDSDLVPIYGTADKSYRLGGIKRKSTLRGSEVPPRPTAKRVEAKTVQAPFSTARIERQIQELAGLAERVAVQRAGNENVINALYFSRLVLHGNASLGLEEDRISDWSPPEYHYLFDHVSRRT